jgi:hypothetical protein
LTHQSIMSRMTSYVTGCISVVRRITLKSLEVVRRIVPWKEFMTYFPVMIPGVIHMPLCSQKGSFVRKHTHCNLVTTFSA